MRNEESLIQQAFIKIIDNIVKEDPRYYTIAIPNGGKRHKRVAITLKAEGVRAGVWDLFILTPAHGYGGLWLECKTEDGTVSKSQREFYDLHKCKYQFSVFRDPKTGIDLVREYLKNGFGNYSGGTGVESKLMQIPLQRKDEVGFEQLSWI